MPVLLAQSGRAYPPIQVAPENKEFTFCQFRAQQKSFFPITSVATHGNKVATFSRYPPRHKALWDWGK